MERKPQKTIKFGVISHYDNFKDCHNVTLVVILLQFTKTQMSDQSSLVGNHEMIVNIITFISFFFHLYSRSKNVLYLLSTTTKNLPLNAGLMNNQS